MCKCVCILRSVVTLTKCANGSACMLFDSLSCVSQVVVCPSARLLKAFGEVLLAMPAGGRVGCWIIIKHCTH